MIVVKIQGLAIQLRQATIRDMGATEEFLGADAQQIWIISQEIELGAGVAAAPPENLETGR